MRSCAVSSLGLHWGDAVQRPDDIGQRLGPPKPIERLSERHRLGDDTRSRRCYLAGRASGGLNRRRYSRQRYIANLLATGELNRQIRGRIPGSDCLKDRLCLFEQRELGGRVWFTLSGLKESNSLDKPLVHLRPLIHWATRQTKGSEDE